MQDTINTNDQETIFKEVDLNYSNEFYDNGIGIGCRCISHCSCDCDRCMAT